ncbi:flagellar basal body rod protein FlgB [Anaerosinus massiliensis]|uniref:flagellar basal body rod protein FlgB n=1 Tax=Massilibacillus massiliensis TaxID=1806837 RepID=UPI000A6D8EB1|nr:flagellar basal body rod protein FlgB [Massilibacillus massiliensis]
MIEKITQSPLVNVLSQSLSASNMRHSVISNNIANVNTPGFKKSEVVFESLLAEQLAPTGKHLQMVRTQDKHLPIDETHNGIVNPQIQTIGTTTMRTDGNNVDIDSEMAALAKNTIYYNAVVRQLGDYFSSMKSVIAGQK